MSWSLNYWKERGTLLEIAGGALRCFCSKAADGYRKAKRRPWKGKHRTGWNRQEQNKCEFALGREPSWSLWGVQILGHAMERRSGQDEGC